MQLRKWREKHGFSLKAVCAKLKCTFVTLSRYETGARRSFRGHMVDAIIEMTYAEVDANDLYGYTPEKLAEIKAKNPNGKEK